MASNYAYNQTYNHSNASNIHQPSPYGSGDPYYNESTGFIAPQAGTKKGTSKWVKIGIPLAVVVIAAVAVGVVFGVRSHKDSSSTSSSSSSKGNQASNGGVQNDIGLFPTATNSLYLLPLYPSATDTALYHSPTFSASSDTSGWPADPFAPTSTSPTNVRTDRPRLIAPPYKWDALTQLIQSDNYLKAWNDTIFANATAYYDLPVVKYFMDGDSGILDNAREIKMRIKAFGYVYRMTKDTKWADRAYKELQNAVSSSFGPDTTDKWNPTHFLDTAEFSAAFGIAYDWFYDILTDDQKATIRSNMIMYGLELGLVAFNNSDQRYTGWWADNIKGNWNCVCNGGLTLGALAILGDDTTGTAESILAQTVPNVKSNCVFAVSDDGSWSETAHYWYFGTSGFAEMAAALQSATGSDQGLLDANPNFAKTGLFHMTITGPGSLFAWGDHGPNKFSTTANGMFLFGDHYDHPEYQLFQRDAFDAPEPWSMFWYNPLVSGAWWDGLAIDQFFTTDDDQWAAFRGSWTDQTTLYVAMKGGSNQRHQTHNDLDAGDFVLDALGTRWAGELGSGNYRSAGYFSNDNQDSQRWLYYRKRTEGQNTILVNQKNQLVTAAPKILQSASTGTKQGSSTVLDIQSSDTALFTVDLTSAYEDVTSFKRGVRTLNGRKQVLLQDDITATGSIMWRMHTNATVTPSGTGATLKIDDKTLEMTVLNAPDGATITTGPATRFSDDPALPEGETDQENKGVTVVMINLPAGTYNLQVLFNPQWDGMSSSDFKTPGLVAIDQWSLTSHD
ncbi:chondroitin AC/alginate lyase [Daedaleopsis nitida]|nr:chondroitin AC/alginate lyase [Daedaleopsis nitida]